jgi:hypothetical protein
MTFGLTDCGHLYDKLAHDSARLEDGWQPYDAFNFVVTAWHLHKDWVAETGSALAKSKRELAWGRPDMRLVLEVLRDLATGAKHFSSRATNRQRVDQVHTGQEVGFYEWFFHEDIPGASVGSNYFSIRVLRNISMAYFRWLLDDAVTAVFPTEISECIAHCNIATRRGPTPPLWLQGTPVHRTSS